MASRIPLDRITDSPFQTRQHYDDERIHELAASIKAQGLIQVPVARVVNGLGVVQQIDGSMVMQDLAQKPALRVQLAVGHTRLRAYRLLAELERASGVTDVADPNWQRMPLVIRPLTDEQMDMLAWAENKQRSDLNPVEEAQAIHDRIKRRDWTHEQAGEELGLTRSAVSNKLRLLRLPAIALDHLAGGEISEAQARVLVSAYDLEAEHPDIIGSLVETHQGRPAQMLQRALSGVPAERLREYLGYAQHHVEAELERRKSQLDFFASEGSETAEVPDISADRVRSEIERINSEHNAAILWIKDPSYIRAADDDVLEKTLGKLRPLVRQVGSIIEDSEAEEIYEHGPTLDRISGGIHYDIDRVSRELDRRKPADTEPGDSFDDGGEQLNKISEAKGMPPIAPTTSAETAPPPKPESVAEQLGLPAPVLDEPYLWNDEKPRWPEGHERAGLQLLKGELFDIVKQYELPVAARYGDDSPSLHFHKENLVLAARSAVQYQANFRCAYALDEQQLRRFKDWCDTAVCALGDTEWGGFYAARDKYGAEHAPGIRAAKIILGELTAVDEAGVFFPNHVGGYNVLCDAEHRRAAVFCYHLFFAEMATPIEAEADVTQSDIEDVSVETSAETEAPHPDTGGSAEGAATEEEEKPLTDGEKHLLAAMAARYEATQAAGHLLAMTDVTGWDAGQALVARGLAQHAANRFGRVDKARLTLTKEGTDLALQLPGVAAAVAEGVPA